jgi:prolipoprotein diacylglyceryltransferase
LGFLLGYFTMGQILCTAMMAAAVVLMLYLNRKTPARAA